MCMKQMGYMLNKKWSLENFLIAVSEFDHFPKPLKTHRLPMFSKWKYVFQNQKHKVGHFENVHFCNPISIKTGPNFTWWHANLYDTSKWIHSAYQNFFEITEKYFSTLWKFMTASFYGKNTSWGGNFKHQFFFMKN